MAKVAGIVSGFAHYFIYFLSLKKTKRARIMSPIKSVATETKMTLDHFYES